MEIFRIEHAAKGHGMWYNDHGEYDPGVLTRLSSPVLLQLPMESDNRYKDGGFEWFTGVEDLSGLLSWFTMADIVGLVDNQYKVYRMESSQFVIEPTQVLYTLDGLSSKAEVSLDELSRLVLDLERGKPA